MGERGVLSILVVFISPISRKYQISNNRISNLSHDICFLGFRDLEIKLGLN